MLALRDGQLREYKGNYTKFLQLEEAQRRRARRSSPRTRTPEIDQLSTLADSMRGQTEKRARLAKVLDRKVERLKDNRVEVTKRERKVTFRLPTPPRSGDVPMTVEHVGVRYGVARGAARRELHHATRRPHRDRRAQRRGQVLAAALPGRAPRWPRAAWSRFGANVKVGYFAQEHEQLDFNKTVLDHLDNATVVTDAQRRIAARRFRAEGLGRPPAARHALGRRARQAGPGDPRGRPTRTCSCSTSRPTTSTRPASRPWAR